MPLADLHFLVAEDHDFQRRAVVSMLHSLGARHVVDAADGEAALRLFREHGGRLDVLITDLDMPGMDGMELIRHISAAGTPISMILTSGVEAAVIASVAAMVRAYGVTLLAAIEKPVTLAKLSEALESTGSDRTIEGTASPPRPFLAGELREALANKEFVPLFRPRVELTGGGIDSVETVPHWRRAGGALLGPEHFAVAVAEARLDDAIAATMLEQAVQQRVRWNGESYEPQMAVSLNLPATSLTQPELADRMLDAVGASGLATTSVILETTSHEPERPEDAALELENLARLRMRGFRLCLGDYGTGASSLEQLTNAAFSELKIARQFVGSAADSEAHRAGIESSIAIAGKLGIKSLADGVETRAQWDLLGRLGCDAAQGDFVARPMLPEELEEWSRRRASFRWWRG